MKIDYQQRLEEWPQDKLDALAEELRSVRSDASEDNALTAFIVGKNVDATTLRLHLAEHLPSFMIPQRFVELDAFPKTANGKTDRKALLASRQLGLPSEEPVPSNEPASNRLEIGMAAVWAEVLGLPQVEVDEDFFELGGNSLLLIKLIGKVQDTFGLKLPLTAVGAAPTVRRLVQKIDEDGLEVTWSCLVPIQEDGARPPYFMVHGLGGGIFDYYRLKPYLSEDQPFYAIQAPLAPYGNLEEMAAAYISEIRNRQPKGPYHLGGYCLGAVVSFEMARQLRQSGEEVASLSLIESSPPRRPLNSAGALGSLVRQSLQHFGALSGQERVAFVQRKASDLTQRLRRSVSPKGDTSKGFAIEAEDYFNLDGYPPAYRDTVRIHFRALRDYKPTPYSGDAFVFSANDNHWTRQDPSLGWANLIEGNLAIIDISGDHHSALQEPHVGDLGRKLSRVLADEYTDKQS